MQTTITIRRLTIATVLKLALLGAILAILPAFMLGGALSFFGIQAMDMTWNNQPLSGLPALLASPFMGLFFGAILGLFTGLLTFAGLWLYSLLRPMNIAYLPVETMPGTSG